MPKIGDTLLDALNLLLGLRACLFERASLACWEHRVVAQVKLCAPKTVFWAHQLQSRSPMVNAILGRDPAQAQTAAASVREGCWRSRAERLGQAPISDLRARCLYWPTPGVLSINFDAAGCHAGRQGRAAGLRKVAGANFSQVFAWGDTSEGSIYFE
eukprot:1152060-Pelagomonas_calceolata.AAC.1